MGQNPRKYCGDADFGSEAAAKRLDTRCAVPFGRPRERVISTRFLVPSIRMPEAEAGIGLPLRQYLAAAEAPVLRLKVQPRSLASTSYETPFAVRAREKEMRLVPTGRSSMPAVAQPAGRARGRWQ